MTTRTENKDSKFTVKTQVLSAAVMHTFRPNAQEAGAEESPEFKAIPVHRVSSRPAKTT